MLFADRKIGKKESALLWKKPFESVQYALRVAVSCLLCLALVLTTSGCSDDSVVSDKHTPAQVKVQVNDCEIAEGASGNGGASYNGQVITIDMIEACDDRQSYLELVCPVWQFYCQQYGLKYPGVMALQGIYEAGLPTNISNVARTDNNLGGLKYASGIPNATEGSKYPASEGNGVYCHFTNVNEYIEAAVWNIAHEGSFYQDAVNNQGTMESFCNALCDIWIDGQKNGDTGYAHYIIDDYGKYGLSKFEGGTLSNGNSSKSAKTTTTTSSDQTNLVGSDNEEKIWNYLKSEGFNDIQTAAIMGNWMRESGLDPSAEQNFDGGAALHAEKTKCDGKTGFGLAQWTYITYQTDLRDFAQEQNAKQNDLLLQLKYFTKTFADRKETFQKEENSKDIETATRWFNDEYERSADTHGSEGETKRINFANEIYERHNGQGASAGTEASDTELCSDINEKTQSTGEPQLGEAAKIKGVDARIEWLYDGNGLPTSKEENDKYLETFPVEINDSSGKRTSMNVTMHKKLKTEIQAIFKEIADTGFKITGGDISYREWGSDAGFKGRFPQSGHTYGHAFDVNPNENYCIYADGRVVGDHYSPGTDPLSVDDTIINIWKAHGFYWGGDWTSLKDYMHFCYFDH